MSKQKGQLRERVCYLLPRVVILSFLGVYLFISLLMYFDYFEPYIYPLKFIRGQARPYSNDVILGPYPHYDDLERLHKKQGVDIVINLMNLKFPHEKALAEREKRNARPLGLPVYDFPLNYLSLQSEANHKQLERIIAFMEKNKGKKFYVHCYRGKDRTGFLAKKLDEIGWKELPLASGNIPPAPSGPPQ